MKKLLLETSFSKIYMIVMIIITLLILGGYFSYAMFTVSKEKGNAISIVTGNLEYKLRVDEEETNKLTVESNSVKDFIVTLSNPNNIKARFNFYYMGEEPSYTKIGYIVEEGMNIPPFEVGTTLEKVDSIGSSNTYIVRVINNSGSPVEFTLGVSVGLDYNDLSLPSNGHLLEEITDKGEVGTVVLDDISKDSIYDDGIDTFITGEYPNNYVWYSGKLWRVVNVNNEEKIVKLVTQWNISTINYSSGSTTFDGSFMEEWLNDTSVDGFLGNLREPEKFIIMDSKWDATEDNRSLGEITRPDGETLVTDAVGLLNIYEYQTSYTGTTYNNGYLNNGLNWWSLTSHSELNLWGINNDGLVSDNYPLNDNGIRPSIILNSTIKIVDGNGTEENPYRLEGDNDTNLSGTSILSRYSGEYLTFGTGENNLYRIVSHENKIGTKITSAEPLKNGDFIEIAFGSDVVFSSDNTIGSFLNGDYLTTYVGEEYSNMIEEKSTWYLGTVGDGTSYKLAKYTDATGTAITSNVTQSKIGLLRLGELMAGQFDSYENNSTYWSLTQYSTSRIRSIINNGDGYHEYPHTVISIKPSLNLKQNVVITSGDGTKENPFTLELST